MGRVGLGWEEVHGERDGKGGRGVKEEKRNQREQEGTRGNVQSKEGQKMGGR